MTQTIGIIGTGMIGGQLARLSVAAGFNVILSNSRSPDSIKDLVGELGERARAATPPDAARASDLVVAAIPFGVYTKLPAEALVGKIVIDTMNYYPERDGIMREVKTDTISTSELVQRHLSESSVVKALNNMDYIRLFTCGRPKGSPERSAIPAAGDKSQGKLTPEEADSYFMQAPGAVVTSEQVKALLAKAVRHDKMAGSMAAFRESL